MNWEISVIIALIVLAFFLVVKKGSCCGTKASKGTKSDGKDTDCCGHSH